MKFIIKSILILLVFFKISVFGQKTQDDSLLTIANLEIYDNPEKSINIVKSLLKKEKDINKSVTLYMLLSTANIAKRNFDESLKYILKAKELAQKTSDLKTRTRVLVSVAIQYQQMELFSKSLETLDEAEQYLSQLPDNIPEKNLETARIYAIRGMIYKSQSNSEIALEKFLKSIESFEKIKSGETINANKSVVYYNIGYCYLNLNQNDKAERAFLQSISYAQKNKAKSLEAFALKGMAELYKQKRENQTALNLLIKAENLCKNTGDLVLNAGIYKEMADNYLAMGNQELYQNYNRKYFEMQFRKQQNELNSINQVIDNHNKETLLKSKNLKNRHQLLMASAVGLGILIIAILLILVIKIRKQNKKYHKEIQQLIRS
ncbi:MULTISPECIES: tetratricopeptide repeat protein [Chryseobacterium]|uniref:Tetratricopeptide (TPR) repeat protein n=1 Tax=Chryseobacterium geocarposphaerae TaxID=1416776 RepID=A0ABU1LIF3_9FLAO|nr:MULTISPECIES: tetratricopeptide repeat protein [Chryseobacterium]MDR6406511.1 tetratricopeptide (TPR) repeat protein [Chryseobacterium geocarposphaerae]MDR6699990.1 tetratricopeptide (TPR) repeat protein [Chryseobacterium ginsenosidimutans]